MFFGGRERELEVHPGRIRGKFETICTNRETDRHGIQERPIHLSHFSLVAVEYQFVCAAE